MRASRVILSLLFVLFMVEVFLLAPDRMEQEKPPMTLSDSNLTGEMAADQVIHGLHLVESRGDKRIWELWAKDAFGNRLKETWLLEQVKVQFFTTDGGFFNVTGEKGEIETQSKNMSIRGNVVMKSKNGYLFTTEELSYDAQAERLTSPGLVQMSGLRVGDDRSLRLSGKGLEAELADSVIEIKDNVKTEKTLQYGQKFLITSQTARFSGKTYQAHFIGDVKMSKNEMKITGHEADFQLDSKQQSVQTILVSGGVQVSDEEKWATSKQIEINLPEDRIVFRGRPRLVQDNDELFGDEIIFSKGGKKVHVENARARVDRKHLEQVN